MPLWYTCTYTYCIVPLCVTTQQRKLNTYLVQYVQYEYHDSSRLIQYRYGTILPGGNQVPVPGTTGTGGWSGTTSTRYQYCNNNNMTHYYYYYVKYYVYPFCSFHITSLSAIQEASITQFTNFSPLVSQMDLLMLMLMLMLMLNC